MSYCLLADLKAYLGIDAPNTSDDVLLQRLLDAAHSRIDSRTQRTFWAAAHSTRTFDPTEDIIRGELFLDADLSHVVSITNGDGVALATTDWYHTPRNVTPWRILGIRTSSTVYWTYTTDYQDAISIVGRWAFMTRIEITAISRASNVVTATCAAPRLSVGQAVTVPNITGFNGTFTVTAKTDTTVTWSQTGTDVSGVAGVLLHTPTEIVAACRRLAAWMYRQKDTQQSGTSQPLFSADGSIVMPSTLPQDVEDTLRPFMRLM